MQKMSLLHFLSVRNIFLIITAIAFYLSYVQPKMKGMDKIKNDSSLQLHLATLYSFSDFDKHSFAKGQTHLRRFFLHYNKSFEGNTRDKLKHHGTACMKYFRKIPLRIENDIEKETMINNSLDNINNILEQYIYETSNRYSLNYNGSYM